jgi:hypothetical protein
MTTLARPQAEDVVICRRSPALFTLGVRSGAPQVRCSTFEEALERASDFASNRHVRVWFTADDREFVPLENEQLLRKLWNEYVEMPGLRLTREQAQRLWSVDEQMCKQLLENLVNAKLLVRGPDGRYARLSETGSPSLPRMVKANSAPRTAPVFRQVG